MQKFGNVHAMQPMCAEDTIRLVQDEQQQTPNSTHTRRLDHLRRRILSSFLNFDFLPCLLRGTLMVHTCPRLALVAITMPDVRGRVAITLEATRQPDRDLHAVVIARMIRRTWTCLGAHVSDHKNAHANAAQRMRMYGSRGRVMFAQKTLQVAAKAKRGLNTFCSTRV